jgi:hypothetical protein
MDSGASITTDHLQGTCGMCLSSWTIGSSLIGIGLTAGQAMGAVVSCTPRVPIAVYLR